MESEFVLGAQETRAYLARLGLERPERPTREALDDLVYAHQCSIPFETIDMYRCTEPPDLEPAHVFDKLVTPVSYTHLFLWKLSWLPFPSDTAS